MTRRIVIVALTALVLMAAACGGDDADDAAPADESSSSSSSSTSTTVAAEPLVILVTNDDGIGAPGIDALVNGLQGLDDVEIVVVAPAENQSGSGDATTEGVTATESATAGGYAGTAVDGKPADSVIYALDELGIEPGLVISGINSGQNIRELSEVSGTVGAAKTAARRGLPALAVSSGLVDGVAEFDDAVVLALDYLDERRAALEAGDAEAMVDSLNVPTCPVGEVRGLVEVPVGERDDTEDVFTVDCESTLEDPVDDAEAFINGFATLSVITF